MATVHDRRLAHKLWGDDGEGLTEDVDDLPYDNEDEVEQLDEEHENLNRTMKEMNSEQDARVISVQGFLRVLASDPLARTELAEKILRQATDEITRNHAEVRVAHPTMFRMESRKDCERKVCQYVLQVMQEEGLQHMAQMAVGLWAEGMLFMVGVSPASGRLVGLRLTQDIL